MLKFVCLKKCCSFIFITGCSASCNLLQFLIILFVPLWIVENDWGSYQSTGEADSRSSPAHHPVTGGDEQLWMLEKQDWNYWTLAHTNYSQCQVWYYYKNVETHFMNFLCCDIMNPWQWSVMSLSSLIQELSWSSVCHGNSKWFAPSDSGSATGVKSSLPHCDSAAHSRRSVLLTYKMLTLTYI